MQREKRIGVAREEPIVFEVVAGIFGGLANVDPMALEGGREPVDGGETETEDRGDCGSEERGPGFVDDGPEERDAGEQVAGDDAEREVREPCAGEREGEWDGGTVEGAAQAARAEGWRSRSANRRMSGSQNPPANSGKAQRS